MLGRENESFTDTDPPSILVGMNGCADINIADAGLLKAIDPSLAEFYLEMTDILITDLDWPRLEAGTYVLDWLAREYFNLEQPEVLK